ncbi:glycosyltransferase [Pseudochrobactrum sp. HB0163]|uniref:glycosyltransferase n=1 Tax=Pseudochrobactrum sp. HB0163 TaxID=3450708 RepID=UPI003F6E0F8D
MVDMIVTFEPIRSSGGGLSTYIRNLIRAHNAVGKRATVLAINHDLKNERKYIDGVVNIIEWNPSYDTIFKWMGYWPSISYAISNKIKSLMESGYSADWIEFPDGFGIGYFTIQRKLTLEKNFKDLKILVTSHCPVSYIEELEGKNLFQIQKYFIKEMEKFCLLGADAIISPSQFHADFLIKNWGIDYGKITVIHNLYEPLSDLPPNEKVSLQGYATVSRVSPQKGIPQLIAVFDNYWQNGGQSPLHIFGADVTINNGQSNIEFLKTKYQKWIINEKLIFRGNIDHASLRKELRQIKALFHPSKYETFAYSVIEHMADNGLVAASQNGGHAEILEHEVTGFIFDAENPIETEQIIHRIDDLSIKQVKHMGRLAAEKVKNICNYQIYMTKREKVLSLPPKHPKIFPFVTGEQRVFENSYTNIKDPILSVVIPHYNLGDLVKETVRSVIISTLTNIEIIIVDDGSTDEKSKKIIEELPSLDQRIKLIKKKNSGVADTRNIGVAAARAKYIALLDADDTIEPTYYERAVSILEHYNNVGFVGCWNNDFDDTGTLKIWTTFNPEMPRQLIFNSTNCAGIIVRKEAYLAHAQHDPELGMFLDDWDSTIGLVCAGIRGVMIPHALFNYRVRPGSLFQDKAHLWEKNYNFIINKHHKTFEKYSREIIAFLNANGSNKMYSNPTFPSASEQPHIAPPIGFGGRLDKMTRGYYQFVLHHPFGKKLRKHGNFIINFTAQTLFMIAKFGKRILQ